MAASNLNLGKASGGVLNIQPADGTTTTSLVLPAINGTVVAADSNGNVGIGVTPSAWGSNYKVLQIGGMGIANRDAGNETFISNNSYHNGTNDIYKSTSYSNKYTQQYGQHQWFTAPSGTANNAITWTQAMTLNNNGNLLVGTITDNGVDKLQVNGSISSGAIQQYASGDLNNFKYITQTIGTYSSAYMSNLPINDHGYLEIIVYSPNNYVMQRFTTLGVVQTAGRVFVRCLNNGVWTAWVEK